MDAFDDGEYLYVNSPYSLPTYRLLPYRTLLCTVPCTTVLAGYTLHDFDLTVMALDINREHCYVSVSLIHYSVQEKVPYWVPTDHEIRIEGQPR